jgi:PAS domain S-box-containing protein
MMLKEILTDLESMLKQLTDLNAALDEALIVAITDVKGNIIFTNQKFCDISQYSRNELLGQNHRIINSGYHSKEFFRNMWKTIANGQIWRGEIRNRAKDGTFYWMDTTIVPSVNDDGKPYQYTSFRIDITERKKAEEFLRRSERIAAVSQIASGIAHEIRNPLAAIQWSVQLLQSDEEESKQQVSMIMSELQRIDTIVNEFMLLSKPEKSYQHAIDFQSKDIRTFLAMIVKLMSVHARRHRVKIELDFEDDIPNIECDENQLKQVFINLIKNSVEALPDGGKIDVVVRKVDDNKVMIRIADNGVGIPKDIISRLGEPFFTTKQKGTGLGLMISQKILEDHGGKMLIQSKQDEGTQIELILPISQTLSVTNEYTG